MRIFRCWITFKGNDEKRNTIIDIKNFGKVCTP